MRLALKRLKVKHEFLHSGLITAGILAVATGIGFLFQSLGFTEENIIIVYVLRSSCDSSDHGKPEVEYFCLRI